MRIKEKGPEETVEVVTLAARVSGADPVIAPRLEPSDKEWKALGVKIEEGWVSLAAPQESIWISPEDEQR